MKISWAGQSCFKIVITKKRGETITLVIDPFEEKLGIKPPSGSADILLVTHNHYDHNNIKSIKGDYFLIDGPGEYEIKRVYIVGVPSYHDDSEGKERGENTIYTIEAEGIKLCHLGDLGQKQLTDLQVEKIGNIDILMVPVGGNYTISAHDAQNIISQIEPKIIIPMHYKIPGIIKVKLDGLEKFFKVMGQNSIEPQSKFSVKKESLPKEKTEIVLLKPDI